MFNVRTAMQNNDALLDNPDGAAYSEDELWSDEDGEYLAGAWLCTTGQWTHRYLLPLPSTTTLGFWSDEDGASYAQHWRELRRKHKGRKTGGAPRQGASQRSRHVMHFNAASQAFIRRKVCGFCTCLCVDPHTHNHKNMHHNISQSQRISHPLPSKIPPPDEDHR